LYITNPALTRRRGALDKGQGPGYDAAMRLSARNRLVGKITEIKMGDVMAHIILQVGDNEIDSVITRQSAEEMHLKVGDTVAAVIKSTEVMLEKA
jgi:molybdopterin-binding protein